MASLAEVPGINNAVDRLQELGTRMDDDVGFKEEDVANIDKIIEALQQLEAEREKVHEELEVNSIKASVLRHKLHFFPKDIDKQIKDAITSARDSNAAIVSSLKSQLADIATESQYLQKKQLDLDDNNAILLPERDKIREEHEEIIQQLNIRMAEKASKQILLNETRDKLRATNQAIVDMEEGIVNLKEDMIQERADGRMEKKRLKKAVYDTTMKTKEQKEANVVKKKELDKLQEQLLESESNLDSIRKSIRRYDTSRSRLEGQERALTAQLNREIKQNEELKQKGLDIAEEIKRNKITFEDRRTELETRMAELDNEIETEMKRNDILEGQKTILEMDVEEAEEMRNRDKRKVDDLKEMSTMEKDKLARKAEDSGRLRQENANMTDEIAEIGETHEVVVAALNKQVEEYREQLGKERQERMDIQQRRDEVQKNVDDFRSDNQKFMSQMNKKLMEGKTLLDKLTRESAQLQKDIEEGDSNIIKLNKTLVSTRHNYETMKDKLQGRISELETGVENYTKSIAEKKGQLEEREPVFKELEGTYDEYTSTYERRKKELVTFKNKKMSLEDSVKRVKRDMDKLVGPREKLSVEVKTRKGEVMEQLKEQTAEVVTVEKEIYDIGYQLKTVMDENHRFEMAIEKYENDIEELKRDMENNIQIKDTLQAEHDQIKGVLTEGWDNDHEIEQQFAKRDQTIVDELARLLQTTEKREKTITTISDKLYEELILLAGFLDNVASRRPKDSREASRSSSAPQRGSLPVTSQSVSQSTSRPEVKSAWQEDTIVKDDTLLPVSQTTDNTADGADGDTAKSADDTKDKDKVVSTT